MIKRSCTALAAVSLLGLAACGGDTTEETTIVEDEPTAAETVDVELPESDPAMEEAETGDSLEISEDGVNATVNDGDTSVTADIDGDPSMRVETD